MPQVPVADSVGIQEQGLQPVYQSNIDVSSGLQKVGGALDAIGQEAATMNMQQMRAQAWDTLGKVKDAFGQWQAQNQPKYSLTAANGVKDPNTGQYVTDDTGQPIKKGYADSVKDWWDNQIQTTTAGMSPMQQRYIARSLSQFSSARVDEAWRYQQAQVSRGAQVAWDAKINADIGAAVRSGNPDDADAVAQTITQSLPQFAREHGMVTPDGAPDPNVVNELRQQYLSSLHAGMVGQLQQSDPTRAAAYLAAHQDEIKPEVFSRLQQGVNDAKSSSDGMTSANQIWHDNMPDGADASVGATAIPIDKMLAAAQQKFAGNPVALKAAEAQITQNYKAFNEAHTSAQRSYKSSLLAAYNGGGSLAQMQAMPEWQKLDGDTREQITEHLQSQQDRALSRQLTRANLQDRQYAIADRGKGQTAMGNYLDLISNPDKLAQLTPDDVQNLRLTMSDGQVQHVAAARLKLNNAADVKNAKLDNDTFNGVAQQFGLKTPTDPGFKANRSAQSAYATLRQNIDAGLQQLQTDKKRPLTRDEKQQYIQQEMGRQVTVDPGFFSSNKTVPLATLSPTQRGQIVDAPVPQSDRQQIVQAWQAKQGRAPTEIEIKNTYLARARKP